MWGRHKKIREWLNAGVITEQVAQAIETYEKDRKSGHFGRGLINLSIFAILIGILSVIASNWYKIPGDVKIGVHIVFNIAIGALAVWADRREKPVWREGATLAFIGLTLTLIILIGQVFQLAGSVTGALTLWMLATLPFFLLLGRTYATAVPWMIAFLVTIFLLLGDNVPNLPKDYQGYFYIGLPALLPLALMADGALDIFRRWRPVLADVFLKTGLVLSATSASFSIIWWGFIAEIPSSWEEYVINQQVLVIFGAGLLCLLAHAVYFKFYKNEPALRCGAAFALVGLFATVLPFFLPAYGDRLIAALAFIAYWVFIGWMAQGLGRMRVVTLAIVIIAIRIYIIYVELFGSLLTTGLGLISGGIIMLAMIYGVRKLNVYIRAKGKIHGAP